jgi:phosphate uptake regulator
MVIEPVDELTEELGRLADETTELGLLAEDMFKNAAAALYTPEPDAARSVLRDAHASAQLHYGINQRALALLTRHLPSGDIMRRVVEVQQVAGEFARIAEHSREIANHALALGGNVDGDLLAAGSDAPMLLMGMLRQTYIEVRAGVVASTTRDTRVARHIFDEDAELVRLYLIFKGILERIIAAHPRDAAHWSRILLVGVELHHIGSRAAAIARTLTFMPPQAEV